MIWKFKKNLEAKIVRVYAVCLHMGTYVRFVEGSSIRVPYRYATAF